MAENNKDQEAPNTIEFWLFAPYNEWAAVRGDFSDWHDIEMHKDPDGYFRVKLELADGDYEYKFNVQSRSPWQTGKRVLVTDPMATEVNEAREDNAVLHVRNRRRVVDEYQWQHDDTPLPTNNQLVMYEIQVADFATDLAGVLGKLDYLQKLGINAIEFMPVAANPGNYDWGYDIRHHCAVENSYGKPTDLKRLIDECHGRGIRVVFDMVFNHSEMNAPLTQIDFAYWYVEHDDSEMSFGPKFDYVRHDDRLNRYPAREYSKKVACYWTTEYHIDGIRFDGTYIINNFDFLRDVGEELRQTRSEEQGKPFYMIAEHIPIDPAVVGPGMPMEGLWYNSFLYQITANLKQSQFETTPAFDWEQTQKVLDPNLDGIPGGITATVIYLANHDQNHLLHNLAEGGLFDEAAFRRARLGFGLLFTARGVPLVWMGDEFGVAFERSTDPHPLPFELLENERNAGLFEYVRRLIALRQSNPALSASNLEFIHFDEGNKLLAYKRWDDDGEIVTVVANFSDTALENYTVPNFPQGQWCDYLNNEVLRASHNQLTSNFGPSECKIYVKQKPV